MASVPMSYRATLYDLTTKSSRQVFLDGEMFRSDVSVGGGPMPPQPPVDPGYFPPQIQHPIVLPPDPPTEPPTEPPTSPPNVNWQWGWVASNRRWEPVYVPGEGQAGPKS